MKKQEIDKERFFDWANNTWQLYAFWMNGDADSLRFYANLNGGYRVTKGNSTIYEGKSFYEACVAWDEGNKCICDPEDVAYYGCLCQEEK